MKIAFSARSLSTPSGGVHQFIRSLVPALERQIADDELFVFYNRDQFKGLAPSSTEIAINCENRLWWDFVLLPLAIRKIKPDAAIFPKDVLPFFTGSRRYTVNHDLAYFDKSLGAYPFLDTLYMRTLMPISARKADGIFAISEHTKKDVLRYTGCTPEKITVTYEAADPMYQPILDKSQLQRVRDKYDLPQKFIMYVGSLSPRKNIVRLMQAFAKISTKIDHKIVLTASKSWDDSDVYQAIDQLGLQDRVKKIGYVEPEDMPALYNLADMYVYVSLYEGFGLPVLEAMQSGCPVIASDTTSIPEVAGDAAMLVNPLDVDAIADAIYKVSTDPEMRQKLINSGYRQAEKFSWDKCAKTMLDVIRNSNVNNK
ncbi:MAG: glycosyltransferase family 4 protein [Planctomycetota bacterium]|jgi:glycosyltransferase involved in cell wall biosynthesis